MKTVAFIGAGSFGTALGTVLAGKGYRINVYDIDQEHLANVERDMENKRYLPGVKLSGDYHFCKTGEEALKGAEFAIFALPAQHLRAALEQHVPFLEDDTIVMNISKGIELKTLRRMSEIVSEFIDLNMALGSGIISGLGYGENTSAALIARGVAEMQRLGVAMGGKPETFIGLAAVGDMIVTCMSEDSRNFQCGKLIGSGMDPIEARDSIGMVVEGMFTAEALHELQDKYNVELPISEAIYEVIHGTTTVQEAMDKLFTWDRVEELNAF